MEPLNALWVFIEDQPNMNAVWISVVQGFVTLGLGIIGYLQLRKQNASTGDKADAAKIQAAVATTKAQQSVVVTAQAAQRHDEKLDTIKVLVNGNLDEEKRKVARLRAKLIDNGIDPD